MKLFSTVSHIERLTFTKHMAVMIKSGLSLSEALSILASQARSAQFKAVLSSIAKDVQNGQSFSSALAKHKSVFDPFYISLVKIADESGTLEESLAFLAVQLAKDYATRKKIQGALLYPEVVIAATVIMGGFISLYILPQLVDFFTSFQVKLPLATQILLSFAVFMKNYGVYALSAAGLLLVGLRVLLYTPLILPLWHKILLRVPLFGDIISYGQLSIFSRNLGVLLKSGVPVTTALKTTADTLSNIVFRESVKKIATGLEHGKNIGDSIEHSKLREFPSFVSKMILIGEKTGKLDESLLYIADFYEDEIDNISKNLSTILEPVLLLCIGLIVGFVAVAIISPIYELTGQLGR